MKRILLAITLLLNINLIAQCDSSLSIEYDTLRSHHNVEFTIDRSWISGVQTYLETGTGDTVVNMVHNLLTGKTKGKFTYDSMGTYEAVLTLIDNATQQVACRDTQLVKIECDAKFDYSFDSTNTINFVNQSNPIDSLAFEWRPLIRSSAIVDITRDLQYTYQQPSVYYPNLMATLPNGKKCGISDTISVNFCPLRWDVSRDSVFFKIHSMSTYFDSVIWKFGDGSVSSSFTRDWLNSSILHTKTKHYYLIDSSYEASISVIDEFGNTCRDTIMVYYTECHAAFTKSLDTLNNRIILANYSSSSAGTQYQYSFGDGTPNVVSTSKNMSHSYSQYGTYEVCVTVSNFTNGQ
ncbi:MAG: hypothetical protein CMC96_07615 [Flavobacteriales bacterium]|nr:hypothetical protein [Flavobacteriales bacterium]|tara:strand:+ start:30551 stop:31600 length:1050 start_codon:yes stop_codon:yes gene_type:complete